MRRRRPRRVSTGPVTAILLEESAAAGLLDDDEPWIPVGWYVYPRVEFDGHDAHWIPQGHGTQVHIGSHSDTPPNWDGFAYLWHDMKAGRR